VLCILLWIGACGESDTDRKPKVVTKKIDFAEEKAGKKKGAATKTEAQKTVVQEPQKPSMVISKDSQAADAIVAAPLYSYDPKGKIDPFEPLFKEKVKPKAPAAKKAEKRQRVPRTPLEKIDLSQLKLSAVIQAPSGNKALVEEASGKGYVVTKGTNIGINWGKVVEIQLDRIIVEEEVQDVLGNWKKQKRELKLPKPPGE
jgi:type IV pilus assembly protein PilP